jgi:hypothetical protein
MARIVASAHLRAQGNATLLSIQMECRRFLRKSGMQTAWNPAV